MKRISRDAWLAISLILILVIVTVAAAIRQSREESIPAYASFSDKPDGAHALKLWLEALGMSTSNESGDIFGLPENASLTWMLQPATSVSEGEWKTIDDWIAKGGTLVLAGNGFQALLAMEHYDFYLSYLNDPPEFLTAQSPLLSSPPLTSTVPLQPSAYLQTERSDYVTLLAAGSRPILVTFQQGKGRVILSATPVLFSNAGLKKAGNPELVLNLLSAAQSGLAYFDEWHHGVRPAKRTVSGPEEWLRFTPAGRSLLFVAGVIFFVLILQGRAFGRPLPISHETARRTPLEYITALANLSRRAGHRQAVLRQFYQQVKRDLGRRYRINPTLPDKDYVELLDQARPNLDTEALLTLLKRLQKPNVSEAEMVQLAREASRLFVNAQENPHSRT